MTNLYDDSHIEQSNTIDNNKVSKFIWSEFI